MHVQPLPSERPLHILAAVASIAVWILLTVSLIGIAYAAMLGLFFFVAHMTLIAHVRGNGVRLGPDQFPEWHAMVVRLSQRLGLRQVPEAYVIQGGGTLNAFATRFLSADIVILYSDLLEACGDNAAACEMIVGHELGHVKRGHLRWHWFLLPSFLIPFLGTALSRAREYTCDRYGIAAAGHADGALVGLTILAAGGRHGKHVNRQALVHQRDALNTGFMTIAEWLSTHPPLARRLAELDPALVTAPAGRARGRLRAIAILGAVALPSVGGCVAAVTLLPRFTQKVQEAQARAQQAQAQTAPAEEDEYRYEPPPPDVARAQVESDFKRLSVFVRGELAAARTLPQDSDAFYTRWNQIHPYERSPFDPFDGQPYGYRVEGANFTLWSSGPDGKGSTPDDLVYDSRSAGSGR